ncbi:LacI family transcriptional regulator [Lutibacter profundi]|uniref:LacI family transcriptional regulator n=1 Tax=Lutibacter profundi TaxID=1622118 RepID=A0A0X8G6R3_9FLAO|nr:LacI family DNA-binding transcriptional regulator [Lutibacter profundi]AMC11054.1 LacI family transcriptional regulator [Lutibacter profundi]
MKPITLKDIALKLNISVTTVSKALQGRRDVSKSTRQSVVDLAEEMNYVPNSVAVNLRTQQTKTIGVIIPTVVHQFFSKVIDGVIEEAEKQGYLVITLQSNENFEFEKKQLQLLMQKRVDGILISLSNETQHCNHLNEIIKNEIPIVLFDKIYKLANCSKVYIDDQQAAYNAVTSLIKKGYKRIAHFRGSLTPQNSIDRFLGYKRALTDNDIEFDASLVYLCNNNDDFNDGYNNANKLLIEQNNVDAIFAITDLIAVGILKCFNEKGIKIPKDIAVFGFSDWFMASVVTPSLSSVKQPSFEMGRKATEILIDEIKNLNKNISYSFQNVVLPTTLAIRDSI